MGGGGGGLGGAIGSIGGAITGGLTKAGIGGALLGSQIGGKVGSIALGGDLGMNSNATADFAQMLNPLEQKHFDETYKNAQQGLTNQADFLKAVQAQGGLQNQSNVFSQLQNVASGTGPNPAQAMLANATGANVANQAALMAGQRGSGANAGMMARQAAMAGGNMQQQAAGQAANMQAQQSLNALNQMGSLATNQANMQANATNAYSNAAQGMQQGILGGIMNQNANAINMQSNVNAMNAQTKNANAQRNANLIGNLTGGIGAAFGLAEGGMVGDQQPLLPMATTPLIEQPSGPRSSFGQSLANADSGAKFDTIQDTSGKGAQAAGKGIGGGLKKLGGMFGSSGTGLMAGGAADMFDAPVNAMGAGMTMMAAEGGKVPALVSPGEVYIPPKDLEKVKKGADPIEVGEKIPGKPKHPGNDYRNDVVPKQLEEGGLVIPNEVLQSKYPHRRAMEFVNAHLASKGKLPRKG